MHAASQFPGRRATDVDDAPAPLLVNQKSDYDDMKGALWSWWMGNSHMQICEPFELI